MRLSNLIPIKLILIIPCLILLTGGCSASEKEGFAIYLTRDDVPPTGMEALSHVELAREPVIMQKDIISYDAGSHAIELKAEAWQRIAGLEVPVRGRSFLVCVDKQPCYWGAFWTPISSHSFGGVTICRTFGQDSAKVIRIELGYPSASFYTGQDPRDNVAVMRSLEQAGKLIRRPAAARLPHSLKGYELYSWAEGGRWYFTLITGTNRVKTLTEVTSGDDIVSADGWMRIRVVGGEAVKLLLERLPENEHIIWLPETWELSGSPGIDIELPPAEVVKAIEEQARSHGLNLVVPVD